MQNDLKDKRNDILRKKITYDLSAKKKEVKIINIFGALDK